MSEDIKTKKEILSFLRNINNSDNQHGKLKLTRNEIFYLGKEFEDCALFSTGNKKYEEIKTMEKDCSIKLENYINNISSFMKRYPLVINAKTIFDTEEEYSISAQTKFYTQQYLMNKILLALKNDNYRISLNLSEVKMNLGITNHTSENISVGLENKIMDIFSDKQNFKKVIFSVKCDSENSKDYESLVAKHYENSPVCEIILNKN